MRIADWLELAMEANLTASSSAEELLREVRELLAIFVASGRTAKSRRGTKRGSRVPYSAILSADPQAAVRNPKFYV